MPPLATMRPPLRLVALIVTITIVPLGGLFTLGWRLFEQDRDLAERQARDRLERLADVVVAGVQRSVEAAEHRLATGSQQWPEGAIALTFEPRGIGVSAPDRLAYLPLPARLREVPHDVFAPAAYLEFQKGDLDAAIASYGASVRVSDIAIRAGALLRLARTLERRGRTREALEAYAELAQIRGVTEMGFDLGLAAIHERSLLFEKYGRTPELLGEARRLHGELTAARPALTGPQYFLFAADAKRWTGAADGPPPERETFAAAVEVLWEEWRSRGGRGGDPQRRLLRVNGIPLSVLWQPSPGGARALLATPAFVETQWLAPVDRAAADGQVRVALGSEGPSLPRTSQGSGSAAEPDALAVFRTAAQAELPWSLVVTSTGAPPEDSFVYRWRLLVSSFLLLVAMTTAASILVVRAVARELSAARVQSDFVAAVSHEFRTPLTALRQFTDRLREQPKLDADERLLCYEAQSRATDRLTRLVESVLDFGRLNAGAQPFRFERCDVAELARAVIADFCHAQPAASPIGFSGAATGAVLADREALTRALWNLLDNAVKYSPGGPRVDVEVRAEGAEVCLAVRDRGMGIAPHERRTILAKFQRGEEARRRGIRGTGLGLAIVDAIVRAHGGRVEVESTPGEGSVVAIVLPLDPLPLAGRQPNGTQPESPGRVSVLRST